MCHISAPDAATIRFLRNFRKLSWIREIRDNPGLYLMLTVVSNVRFTSLLVPNPFQLIIIARIFQNQIRHFCPRAKKKVIFAPWAKAGILYIYWVQYIYI